MARRHRNARSDELTRRDFMRAVGCAALTTTSIVTTIWDLRLINAAIGQQTTGAPGYKALVCIFLFGGNDMNNVVVPLDATRYSQYSTARGTGLAIPSASLLPLNYTNAQSHLYGLHPSCSKLQQLFDAGKAAIVANVGTLVVPINTKAEYIPNSSAVPPQLFSHSDQVIQWQTSVPDQPTRTGWGGRCADLLNSQNNNPTVAMSLSLSGINTFEVGKIVNQFTVGSNGAVSLTNIGATHKTAMQDILNLPHPNLNQAAFATITDRAIDSADLINFMIGDPNNPGSPYDTREAAQGGTWVWNTPFITNNNSNSLGSQLKMIARLIAAPGFGHQRQIFFAAIGGYDLHASQVGGSVTTGAHANLLTELSEGMNSLQKAMEQLGSENQVTTFTMSDFGRTCRGNNTIGSDHGWGSHQFVVGGSGAGTGSVNGKNVYGTFPTLVTGLNGPDDTDKGTGTGRWIPKTAVDQYSATLATWFGVQSGNLATVFPNIGRFAPSDLGFMNAAGSPGPLVVPATLAPNQPTRRLTPRK